MLSWELKDVSDEPAQEGPINGRYIGISSDDACPCFASDKTIKEESKNPSHDHADNNWYHSFFSHSPI